MFEEHHTESDFYDVTVVCKSNGSEANEANPHSARSSHKTVKAHKFVLSSCSTFFSDILKSTTSMDKYNKTLFYSI